MKVQLAPSARRFLPELATIAELAATAAAILRQRVADPTNHAAAAADLSANAREAYRLAAAVMLDAPGALVPPIDGDDAADLAWRLQEVVAAVRQVAVVNDSLRPVFPDVRVTYFINLLVEAIDSLEGAATTLTDGSRAREFASEARRIGRQGDRAYAEAMGALLAGMPDPLGVVRQAEIYRTLRESLRACVRAAASVERIALKQFVS